MAIVRVGGGGAMERPGAKAVARGAKAAGKKSAKHAIEKHAAKKHAAKKHAAKKHAAKKHAAKEARRPEDGLLRVEAVGRRRVDDVSDSLPELARAFHSMQRAGAVISLLEPERGGDLRMVLDHGIALYRAAVAQDRADGAAACATALLRAAEHLGMAGLYSSRYEFRVDAPPPERAEVEAHLRSLAQRLGEVRPPEREHAARLLAMARELLRRVEAAKRDAHMRYELVMAADGICGALEEGL